MTKCIVLLVGIGAMLAGGCAQRQGNFEVLGQDVISTTAPLALIMAAVQEVHGTLGQYTRNPDGSQSSPSFHQSGRHWSTGTPGGKPVLTRSTTEFAGPQGQHYAIEVITGKDMRTLVFFSSSGTNGPFPLVQALLSSLQTKGVKPLH